MNPLAGAADALVPALGRLTHDLGHAEWEAFLPSGDGPRAAYDRLGLLRHPYWGDRVRLFEWAIGPPGDPGSTTD